MSSSIIARVIASAGREITGWSLVGKIGMSADPGSTVIQKQTCIG